MLKSLSRLLDEQGSRQIDAGRMTIGHLCDYYIENYCQPAKYIENRKVAGLRSAKVVAGYVSIIRKHFGKRLLRSITYHDLRVFRAVRLNTPTKLGKARTIATVNREMAYVRRLLTIATREGWITRNPFAGSESLISISDERKRERILTREEESSLLQACSGRRAHLRAIIICALDTGMRRGEILKLRWRDVDIENRLVTVQAFNTKTMKLRQVSITSRFGLALEALRSTSTSDENGLVFGITDTFKTAFNGAVKASNLNGLRFHDLRHCAASRLVQGQMPLQLVGRLLGHTQPCTTYRYVNANTETLAQAAAILDAFQLSSTQQPPTVIELVN